MAGVCITDERMVLAEPGSILVIRIRAHYSSPHFCQVWPVSSDNTLYRLQSYAGDLSGHRGSGSDMVVGRDFSRSAVSWY